MALNSVIRRAASRVVPLALRAAAGSQRCLHHHSNPSVFFAAVNNRSRNLLQRPFPSFVQNFSSKTSSDESLLRVIETEIQCAADSQEGEKAEEIPQGFPFEIEDHPGQQTITLTREYHGETITVEVHMPDLVTGEENERDNDDDEEESNQSSSIPLVVRVAKRSGPSLEFGVTAYPDEIVIDSLSIKDPENSEDEIPYEGPDFADLDENLQKAFLKYLEIRGVKPSTTNFLHEYMINKDSREYVTWLTNLQEFIKA